MPFYLSFLVEFNKPHLSPDSTMQQSNTRSFCLIILFENINTLQPPLKTEHGFKCSLSYNAQLSSKASKETETKRYKEFRTSSGMYSADGEDHYIEDF